MRISSFGVGFVLLGLPFAGAKPLNVVLFLADDLGIMDTSPYNPETFYDTPAIQKLADGGVRFDNGYAACPVCSPSRSAILTGQWPSRTRNTDFFGAPNQFFGQELPSPYNALKDGVMGGRKKFPLWPASYLGQLADSHVTLAEALKKNGYATCFAGKWHLGREGSFPEDHGFDKNFGGIERGGPYGGKRYFSPYGNPKLSDGPDGEHLPDRLARETANFIVENKDQPFFAMLSFYSVHTPLMGRPDLVKKYQKLRSQRGLEDQFAAEAPRKNRTVQSHAVYGAMVEAMDQAVGTVLDSLDQVGVADRTLVIFTSDNGGLSTSEGSPTSNLPYRAGKGWLYEGGIREPVIVRLPGVVKAGSESDWLVSGTDFYPTILDAAGLNALGHQHKDGVSFLPALEDAKSINKDRVLYWHYPHWGNQGGSPGSAVRSGKWKLIDWQWKPRVELFDLESDAGEKQNLAEKYPEVVKKLSTTLAGLHKETGALMPAKNPDAKLPFEKW